MKIAIGSDKSGFAVKEAVKAYLSGAGLVFDDLGTTDLNEVHPYYQVAGEVAPLLQAGVYDRAVLICGTGAGMCVVSNKFRGVYAVACESVYAAKMARAINNANILCLGGWILAWNRFPWFAKGQRHTYLILWAGFILLMNGLCVLALYLASLFLGQNVLSLLPEYPLYITIPVLELAFAAYEVIYSLCIKLFDSRLRDIITPRR